MTFELGIVFMCLEDCKKRRKETCITWTVGGSQNLKYYLFLYRKSLPMPNLTDVVFRLFYI